MREDERPDRSSSPPDDGSPRADGAGSTRAVDAPAGGSIGFEVDQELIAIFVGEALDHLGSIEASVLALEEASDDPTALNEVFRLFHTIKGSAGALGFVRVEELAHVLEDLLDRARRNEHHIGSREVELILAAVDLLTSMIRDGQGRPPEAASADLTEPQIALKAAVEQLLEQSPSSSAGEAASPSDGSEWPPDADATASESTEAASPGFQALSHAADPDRPGHPHGPRATLLQPTIKVDTRKLDSLVDLVGELVVAESMIHQDAQALTGANERLNRTLAQFQRLTHELHQGAIAMRLVPIRQTFQRMHRLVRDLSRKSGKPVDLTFSGEDTELDRKVVEEIADPLMHMLRNSVDHGIEDADTRRRTGKPPRGRLSLSASHEGGSVLITVSDDGRGLDADLLYERAVASELLEAGSRPPDAELHALIFRSGFSTAKKVTEMSGRGIGMDVVRRNVETLRGRIEIRSQKGEGTTFLIKLPLTLATIEGLLLGVNGQRFVLPTFAVQESLRPSRERLHAMTGQGWLVNVRDQLLPVARLSDLFSISGAAADPTEAVLVVVEDAGQRLALMVDELLGKQNVVIKTLGETFNKVEGVAGGAILADGRIGLILDAGGLVRLCERDKRAQAA